jgi:hypothetical protein
MRAESALVNCQQLTIDNIVLSRYYLDLAQSVKWIYDVNSAFVHF